MMSLLLHAVVHAAPPDYTSIKVADDCTLYSGPTDSSGNTPMFADCHWPEVDPTVLQDRLRQWESYDAYIFAITSCTILKTDGARTLVHQVQVAPAIANREVAVWMEAHEVEGGVRVTWKNDPSEPLQLAKGSIRAPINEGYWEVTDHPEGGAKVSHWVHYDPGGRVPTWLVRRFSVGGLESVMRDVRALAVSEDEQVP